MKARILLLCLLSEAMLYGQTATFKWSSEMCEFESTYNTKQYSQKLIADCHFLCFENVIIENTPLFVKPKEIEALRTDSLEKEYLVKSTKLKNLELPKTKYWESFRQSKLKELEQWYTLAKLLTISYTNPKILNQFKRPTDCTTKHYKALIANGDSLLKDWKEVMAGNALKNCCPEKIWETYNEQFKSADKLLYARIEVLTYGWWNCAIETVETSAKYETNKIDEFSKLFINTKKLYCEEP